MSDIKRIGIIKQVDINGRVVLPSDFRKMLDIDLNDNVEIVLVEKNKNEKVLEIRKVK